MNSLNYCLNFDGINDWGKAGGTVYLGESYTLEGWFRCGGVNGKEREILTFWKAWGSAYIHIELQVNGTLRYLHRVPAGNSGGYNLYTPTPIRYDDGVWHHFAAVYDGSTGTMKLYVDRQLKASATFTPKHIKDNCELYFGSNGPINYPQSRPYLHLIDEIRIWNIAVDEIYLQYGPCYELSSPYPPELIHYYKMNEGSGTTTSDEIAGNTAYLYNGVDWFFPGFPEGCGYGTIMNDLVLWYDAWDLDGNPTSPNPPSGTPVSLWVDKTSTQQNATQNDQARMPTYRANGLNNKPTVEFVAERNFASGYGWANDDVMGSVYHPEITSAETDIFAISNDDFVAESKTLFVVFKTPSGPLAEEILQQRQVLVEFGETTSGFNIYIDNGVLCFGMWNRLERRFVRMNPNPPPNNIFTLSPNTIYLAVLEYNSQTKRFRAILSKSNQVPGDFGYWVNVSPNVPFRGITRDPDDNDGDLSTGIGGEVQGTRFHDFNIFTLNYAYTYTGMISEVLLYNAHFNISGIAQIYNYLNNKYGTAFLYPEPANFPMPKIGWEVIAEDEAAPENDMDIYIKPQPASVGFTLGINMQQEQVVEIELFDTFGKLSALIFRGKIAKGLSEFNIDGGMLTSGIYVVRIKSESASYTRKVVIAK